MSSLFTLLNNLNFIRCLVTSPSLHVSFPLSDQLVVRRKASSFKKQIDIERTVDSHAFTVSSAEQNTIKVSILDFYGVGSSRKFFGHQTAIKLLVFTWLLHCTLLVLFDLMLPFVLVSGVRCQEIICKKKTMNCYSFSILSCWARWQAETYKIVLAEKRLY